MFREFRMFGTIVLDSLLGGRLYSTQYTRMLITLQGNDEMGLKSCCEGNNRLHILQEWDTEKNLPITPDAV